MTMPRRDRTVDWTANRNDFGVAASKTLPGLMPVAGHPEFNATQGTRTMKTTETNLPLGWDRMSGLLAWWGIPSTLDAGEMKNHADRTQALVAELNRLFQETSSSQVQSLSEANQRFTQDLQELLNTRQPSDVMAAQAQLVTGLMESAAVQASAWAKLTQDLHGCCSAMVRAADTDETGHSASGGAPTDAARPVAKDRGKPAAQS